MGLKDIIKRVCELYKKRQEAHEVLLEVDYELDNLINELYEQTRTTGKKRNK